MGSFDPLMYRCIDARTDEELHKAVFERLEPLKQGNQLIVGLIPNSTTITDQIRTSLISKFYKK